MTDLAIHIESLSKEFIIDGLGDYQRATEVFAKWIISKCTGKSESTVVSRKADVHSTRNVGPTRFLALNDINLEVKRGETLGIIGSNGAGKSTLLKILSKIVTPTRGRVGVAGRIGCLLEVGTGFHPELTGRENVYLNGAILGMSRKEIRRRFDEIVDFAEVGQFLDMPVKRYSNGMLIRLGFSVAAHLDPDVLIVDEVLGVGDASFQKKSLGKAREFRNQGRTVLMVSHNLPMIASFCSRAILLKNGVLAADGFPTSVIDQHLSHTSETIDESSPMWTNGKQRIATDYLELTSVRVKNGELRNSLTTDASIDIEIDYEVTEPGHRVCFQIVLIDETGISLMKSINAPAMSVEVDPFYDQVMQPGQYTCRGRIPANLLNARRYLLSISIGEEPNRVDQIAESILGFQVHDASQNIAGTNISWDGYLIRPPLAWRTSKRL